MISSRTRQYEVVRALFNGDRLVRRARHGYLQESAQILRAHRLDYKGKATHSGIVFMLSRTEIAFVSPEFVDYPANAVMRVGNVYLSKGFADLFFSEMMMNSMRVTRARTRLVAHFIRCGCRVAQLLPEDKKPWWLLLFEKILMSSAVQARQTALLYECADHHDCTHVSMDGLVRPARRIVGQEDYRVSRAKRNAAPIGDADALRRIVSVRSRTGAVLAVVVLPSEAANVIAPKLRSVLPEIVRKQVLTVAADAPSDELLSALRSEGGFDNLKFLTGDPTHLSFSYESAQNRKKTEGARVLRSIQVKFNQWTVEAQAHFRTSPVTDPAPDLTPEENAARAEILAQSMPSRDAKRRLQSLSCNLPYLARVDYIKDLAALCSVYPDEVRKKTSQQGVPLARILWRACAPSKFKYYQNHVRRLGMVTTEQRAQFSSGTTAAEVLNKELNGIFRNVQTMYQSTLLLNCNGFWFLKLLTHNIAEYCPAEAATSQAVILAHNMAAWSLSAGEWSTVRKQAAPLMALRAEQRQLVLKKPAVLKRPATNRSRGGREPKRHTFNKKRAR